MVDLPRAAQVDPFFPPIGILDMDPHLRQMRLAVLGDVCQQEVDHLGRPAHGDRYLRRVRAPPRNAEDVLSLGGDLEGHANIALEEAPSQALAHVI